MVSTSGQPDAASLEIDDPAAGRRTVQLKEGTTSLGRGADNEIQILIPHVSKHHAKIRSDGEGFVLLDTGSKAGVFVNGNAYRQSDVSGDILLQQANSGGSGTVASSALESSTVDLATEFTKMIVTQRAYSASARVITTADEMLEELIRIR